MPRITAVKPRAFCSTQDPDRLPEVLDLMMGRPLGPGDTLDSDLGDAVEADYAGGILPGSDDAQSDIYRAWDEGYHLWAAHLLQGATECAATDAVLWAYRFTHGPAFDGYLRARTDAELEDVLDDPDMQDDEEEYR